MAISLAKGGNVSLTKQAPGLSRIIVGLGWNVRRTDGAAFDLDASAFIQGDGGRVRSDADFIFYNQPSGANGAVEHKGDNRTGEGQGDDEQVHIDLAGLGADVQRITFGVTIHEADTRMQNFGMVDGAFIRVVDAATGTEIARFDLSEDMSAETCMLFGEVYRHGGEWKFKAIGQGFAGGLGAMARSFGVNL